MLRKIIFTSLLLSGVAWGAYLQGTRPLEVVSWNLESPGHGSDPGSQPTVDLDFLCQRIQNEFAGVDLFGFCEVDPSWADPLEKAVEACNPHDYKVVVTQDGGFDRLAIAYNADRFFRVDAAELKSLEGPWPANGKLDNFRPALVMRLRDRLTNQEFLFMVNHLARSNRADGPEIRRNQARILRSWLAGQSLPVLAVGDYNFDYDVKTGPPANSAFSLLTQGDLFHWLRPVPLVATEGHCDHGKAGSRFQSVLDFAFVANGAKQWGGHSTIVAKPDDFCPEEKASDHRPLRTRFEVPNE